MSGDIEGELLGDPRLKNGLTYYPGVRKQGQVVVVSNVVCLSLVSDSGQPYTGYGFLKGLWLWRDQPYIRVQYLAPVATDLPADAICFCSTPGTMPELLVTNTVGDLELSALQSAVQILNGPLRKQLFQQNVSGRMQFQCARHLDTQTQRVQALDDAFRLTPVVVPFSGGALQAIAHNGELVPPAELPEASSPAVPAAPHTAPSELVVPAAAAATSKGSAKPAGTPTASAPLAPTASAATAAKQPASKNAARAAPGAAVAPIKPPSVKQLTKRPPTAAGDAADALVATQAAEMSRLPRHLLKVVLRHPLRGRCEHVRYPGSMSQLRSLLEPLFGVRGEYIRLYYEEEPGADWVLLRDDKYMHDALQKRGTGAPLRIRLRGPLDLHSFQLVSMLIAVANLFAQAYFALRVLYPNLCLMSSSRCTPSLWAYFVLVIPIVLLFNLAASVSCFAVEYSSNAKLRNHFDRRDGDALLLTVVSLLGPAATLFACKARLPGAGAGLSLAGVMRFYFCILLSNLFFEPSMLLASLQIHHGRISLDWDAPSLVALAAAGLSLLVNVPFNSWQLLVTWRQHEDAASSAASSAMLAAPG